MRPATSPTLTTCVPVLPRMLDALLLVVLLVVVPSTSPLPLLPSTFVKMNRPTGMTRAAMSIALLVPSVLERGTALCIAKNIANLASIAGV